MVNEPPCKVWNTFIILGIDQIYQKNSQNMSSTALKLTLSWIWVLKMLNAYFVSFVDKFDSIPLTKLDNAPYLVY